MNNIEMFGVYPPPIGGVSVHVKRLIHGLNQREFVLLNNYGGSICGYQYIRNVKCVVVDVFLLMFKSKRIIHLHTSSPYMFLLFLLFGYKHDIGLTIHNQRMIKVSGVFKKNIIRFFLRKCEFIILNSESYKRKLCDSFLVDLNKIHIVPAFIPPMESDYKGLPDTILDFRNRHSFLLSGNAFRLVIEEGVDLYGLDLLIELVRVLRNENINAGLLFCLPCIGDVGYYEKIRHKIEKLNLNSHVEIVSGLTENAFEYWEISDVFIRPTTTDIEGISVKEALWANTPVVASDVCERPIGAVLFKNRDFLDLKAKVLNIYKNKKPYISDFDRNIPNVVNEILEIYNSIRNK